MAVLTNLVGARLGLLGAKVSRATAVTGLAGAAGTIFTIAGGRVVITGLVGELTIATGATASNGSIQVVPTSGTTVVIATATSVASKEVGTKLCLPTSFGGALSVQTAGAGPLPSGYYVVAATGSVQMVTSADPTGGASAKWDLLYVPLDDGATVVAA